MYCTFGQCHILNTTAKIACHDIVHWQPPFWFSLLCNVATRLGLNRLDNFSSFCAVFAAGGDMLVNCKIFCSKRYSTGHPSGTRSPEYRRHTARTLKFHRIPQHLESHLQVNQDEDENYQSDSILRLLTCNGSRNGIGNKMYHRRHRASPSYLWPNSYPSTPQNRHRD